MSINQNFPNVWASLVLDFENSKTLDPRITFTRSSTATYVGADGYIKTAVADEPRFDHDPETGESLGLLIEESRINYQPYSQQVGGTSWGSTGYIVELNTQDTKDPSGNYSASKITDNGGFYITGVGSLADFNQWSIFAKAGNSSIFQIRSHNNSNWVVIDITTKTVTTINSPIYTSVEFIDYPNGWVRVLYTGATGSAFAFRLSRTIGDYLYFWGAQAEIAFSHSSYIPTTSSAVTRQPDNASITGTNFTDFYNQTEGSIFWNGIPNQLEDGCQGYHFDDGTSNNRHFMRPDSGSPQISYTSSGTNQILSVPAFGEKIAYAYKSNDYGASQDGLLYSIPSLSSVPSGLIQLGIGYRADNNDSHINGHIKQLRYYPERLTNTQLQNLTK